MNDMIDKAKRRPRRTMLYVSADIEKHMRKSADLPTDAIIFDLYESIAPEFKQRGRERLTKFLKETKFHGQEIILRVNQIGTSWLEDDLKLAATLPIDAVLLSGVKTAEDVKEAAYKLEVAGGGHLPLMSMIETPMAVLNALEIAGASERLVCIAVSNANLMTSMRLPPSPDRTGLFTSLSIVVLAARAHGISVVDGAHLDITDPHACEYACRQSRDFGFDGKAVIHPVQLAYTNDAFSPKPKDIEKKKQIIELMEEAIANGRSYAMLDSRLLQPSELDAARRCIEMHEAIEERNKAFDKENDTYVEAVSR
ncbi:MAG: CoA ester lyase [Chromatiales bacterium]|nr:CoA ester lyase [Chromatiales bacterium]